MQHDEIMLVEYTLWSCLFRSVGLKKPFPQSRRGQTYGRGRSGLCVSKWVLQLKVREKGLSQIGQKYFALSRGVRTRFSGVGS